MEEDERARVGNANGCFSGGRGGEVVEGVEHLSMIIGGR
jgi:hypothetical protein